MTPRAGPRSGPVAEGAWDNATMSGETHNALVERLRRCLETRPEIQESYLFGSAARGELEAHSDLDVAVRVDPALVPEAPYGYRAQLATELMEAAGGREVDVVVLNVADPVLYHRVLRDGERLTSRDLRATTTREGYALSRYCDWVPQLAKIDAAHRARIERGEFGR